jgi:hypothetical protein
VTGLTKAITERGFPRCDSATTIGYVSGDVASSLAGSAVTVVLSVGIAWLQDAVRSRSRDQRRNRRLKQIQEEIATIEVWGRAYRELDLGEGGVSHRQAAEHDLNAAYTRFRDLLLLSPDAERPSSLKGSVSRLLLRDLPGTRGVRLARGAYYVSLALFVFWVGIWVSEQQSWADPGELFASAFAFVVLAILPAWFLAWLARRVARRGVATEVPLEGEPLPPTAIVLPDRDKSTIATRFNPPPNWPRPPEGWNPSPGWQPDPGWGALPEGWQLWVPQMEERDRRE